MTSFTSAEVVSNGVRLHYYRSGEGKPSLVLAHGITDDGLCWLPLADALANGYDIILADARGHGKSDAPEDGYTLGNLAADLAGLIQALGLERPVLLGHSMGAITALTLAGMFPALPRAILLEDPPLWMPAPGQAQNAEHVQGMIDWIAANKRKTRADLLAEARGQNPAWSEAELGPWADAKHRYSPRIAALAQPADIATLDIPYLLSQVACPALLMHADPALGSIVPTAAIDVLQAIIPQLKTAYIPRAGHNIRRDQFKRYLEIVRGFLTSLEL